MIDLLSEMETVSSGATTKVFLFFCELGRIGITQGVKLFEMGCHPNFDLPFSPRIFYDINPIPLE